MCRWVAYSGNAIRPAALLYDTPHSLVEQSRRDRLAGGYPNADGFGLGWYGDDEAPGLYRSIAPAWGDRNLREIAARISIAALPRPHPRRDRDADRADQLPPVPPRPLALHAQRLHRRTTSDCGATCCSPSTPVLRRDRGHDGLRADVPPRADVRARGRSAAGARAHGRVRRGRRASPRGRASAADDGRGERRRACCGPRATRAGRS